MAYICPLRAKFVLKLPRRTKIEFSKERTKEDEMDNKENTVIVGHG